jgi:hypothetical protein
VSKLSFLKTSHTPPHGQSPHENPHHLQHPCHHIHLVQWSPLRIRRAQGRPFLTVMSAWGLMARLIRDPEESLGLFCPLPSSNSQARVLLGPFRSRIP